MEALRAWGGEEAGSWLVVCRTGLPSLAGGHMGRACQAGPPRARLQVQRLLHREGGMPWQVGEPALAPLTLLPAEGSQAAGRPALAALLRQDREKST